MAATIDLSTIQRNYVNGEATCLHCRHKWNAVAQAGDQWFNCPSCGTKKGYLIHHVRPVGEKIWSCKCGCEVFYIMQKGPLCPNCGEHQRL